MLFDGDLLLDMEMTIYEDLMVKCGGFSVTLSGSHFQFRTPFTSVRHPITTRTPRRTAAFKICFNFCGFEIMCRNNEKRERATTQKRESHMPCHMPYNICQCHAMPQK
jgi:hypothetical protein